MPRHAAVQAHSFRLEAGQSQGALASGPSMVVGAACTVSDPSHRETEGAVFGDRRTGSVQPGEPCAELGLGAPAHDGMVARVRGQGDASYQIPAWTARTDSEPTGKNKVCSLLVIECNGNIDKP